MTEYNDYKLYIEAHEAAYKIEFDIGVRFTEEELKEFVRNYILENKEI